MAKKILLMIIALALTVCLFACGGGGDTCKNHADTNGDGLCEECGKAAEPSQNTESDITLIDAGEAKFQIVLGDDTSTDVKFLATGLKSTLKSAGIDIVIAEDVAESAKDIEVLVGTVTTRGEKYQLDRYEYGLDGYAIKIIENKIVIVGGSDDSLKEAFEIFGFLSGLFR